MNSNDQLERKSKGASWSISGLEPRGPIFQHIFLSSKAIFCLKLLLKVLEVLDPDRKLEDTWTYRQGIKKRTKEPIKLLKKRSTQVYLGL